MIIGIDASRAQVAQRTGTEHYSLELISHLLQLLAQREDRPEAVLYCNGTPAEGLFPSQGKHQVRSMPLPRLWTHLRLSLEMIANRPDVLFVPSHVLPVVQPQQCVATVHDLGHLYYPEAYPKAALRYHTWATQHNVRCAAHLLADSEATKADIVKHFSVETDRITVVYPGVDARFYERQGDTGATELQQRYGIKPPYILYVGTLQPRKNVERLIDAYAKARQTHGIQEQLVLAGRMGWLPEGILHRLQQVGETVTLAGYVPEEDLPALYAGATVFVLPSLFEGFGLPLVEAMACGTPVIASTSSCLPEVVGDAGLLVDPHDIDALAGALAQVCHHKELREALRVKGVERARRFSWAAAAQQTLAVLEQVGTVQPNPLRFRL